MNSILNKEPVLRAEKSLKQFSSDGSKVKLMQTGRAQQYLMLFLGGVIVISLLILFII